MSIDAASTGRQPKSPTVPAPPGATLASFVLFATLVVLLAMVYAISEWWHLVGGFGFPSDAAWARAVFARNLASREGLCFNPGVPAAGAAGSSWIAALAFIGFFTGKFLTTAKLLGVLSVILMAYLAWHVTLALLGDWRFAFVAGLLVAASPRLTWLERVGLRAGAGRGGRWPGRVEPAGARVAASAAGDRPRAHVARP
jgi:hypothetical protein